jgi:hypothetical protein
VFQGEKKAVDPTKSSLTPPPPGVDVEPAPDAGKGGILLAMTEGMATFRKAVGGVGDELTPAAAEAVLALIVAAVPRLREKFARPEEVDEAMLQHFVESGMSKAPESSEKEKGEDFARPCLPLPRQQPTLARGANKLLLLCEWCEGGRSSGRAREKENSDDDLLRARSLRFTRAARRHPPSLALSSLARQQPTPTTSFSRARGARQ